MEKTYAPAKMDKSAIAMTTLIFVMTAAFLIIPIFAKVVFGMLPAGILIAISIAVSWQMKPSHFTVSDTEVIIFRGWPFKNIHIPISEIRDARAADLSGSIRTCGNGGGFGYGGWYESSKTGKYFAAATTMENAVLICGKENFAVTPANVDEFIEDVNARVARDSASFDPAN